MYTSLSVIIIWFGILSPIGNDKIARSTDSKGKPKKTITIHIRELAKPERTIQQPVTADTTVIDAIENLKVLPQNPKNSDFWLVRLDKDGKAQILAIDWIAISQDGSTETNFLLQPGDRIMIQRRFPERGRKQ